MPDSLRARPSLLIPAGAVVALMVLWAVHNGGYDADTWYWGALVVLGVLSAAIALGIARRQWSRATKVALLALAAYLAWSYLSMAWAQTPGWALEGSNRVLLYTLVFALFLLLPWRRSEALLALTSYALAIGVIAVVLLLRLASHDHLAALVLDGRLAAPTGYFNSTVALFMTGALLATVLATRRELPGLLRGLLIGAACASLQLCVVGQSRGWLFTLPVVLVLSAVIVRERLRVAAAAVLPLTAALIPVHRLLAVFGQAGHALDRAAMDAGHEALLICAGMIVIATLIAWAEALRRPRPVSRVVKRRLGAAVGSLAILLAVGGAVAATHGHPSAFVKRQWHGFIHPSAASNASSHFAAVGSGRYDFWRVAMHATAASPLGGLGQDNFADYYVSRRRTGEEPRWTHSVEIRLVAHTGVIGAALFLIFLGAALTAAARSVRRGPVGTSALAAAALLPLVVWFVHGSVDWLWEVPALSGPAFGFLGMAVALGDERGGTRARWRIPRRLGLAAGVIAVGAAVCVLGFPYLSVRELSTGIDNQTRTPVAALSELRTAAELNPLTPDPTRLAGLIALRTGRYNEAEQRFMQTISREPGGWFAWLGAGLAASILGDTNTAEHDFRVAVRINPGEATLQAALEQVRSLHPLTPAQALARLETT